MRSSVLVLAVSLLALPATAQAHFTLLAPPPASTTPDGKGDPPCGPTTMLSNTVTPVVGGSTLTIKINETVFHPGFYRVALSIKSRSELPADNVVKDANGMVLLPTSTGMSATADYETNPVFPVLADNLFPHTTATKMFSGDVTLPNVNCDKCTLQVIEFMADHPSNGPKAGYFYHNCADLKITADTSKPVFDPTAGSGAGGGSSGGAGSIAGAGGTSGTAVAGAAGGTAIGIGGTGGSSVGASVGGSGPSGISGGGSAAMTVAGAPAIAGSASIAGAASAAAGTTGTASTGDGGDSGGCAVSNHAAGSKPLLSLLLGLLVLGRRRNRRR